MLFQDEFAKLTTESRPAILWFSNPEQKKTNHFLVTTPEIPPWAAAEVYFSHNQRPAAPDEAKIIKDRNSKIIYKLYTYANRYSYRVTLYSVQNKHAEHSLALNIEGLASI